MPDESSPHFTNRIYPRSIPVLHPTRNYTSQAFSSLEASNLHFVRKQILPYFIDLVLFCKHYYIQKSEIIYYKIYMQSLPLSQHSTKNFNYVTLSTSHFIYLLTNITHIAFRYTVRSKGFRTDLFFLNRRDILCLNSK
jgi:hypothetical protein